MHVFPHGTSILVKNCLVAMLGDSERTTSVMKTKSSSCRSFKSNKRFVGNSLIRLITKDSHVSPGLGLILGFVQSRDISRNNELFCNRGLTGMLKAIDIGNIDKVSLFLNAIVDAYCRNENADATRTYTSYVDMNGYLF